MVTTLCKLSDGLNRLEITLLIYLFIFIYSVGLCAVSIPSEFTVNYVIVYHSKLIVFYPTAIYASTGVSLPQRATAQTFKMGNVLRDGTSGYEVALCS